MSPIVEERAAGAPVSVPPERAGAGGGGEAWRAVQPPAEFAACGAPKIDEEEVARCPVCGSGEFAERAVGFDYEYRTCANPWRLVGCRGCGHVWLNPRPALSTLGVIYPPDYYAYHYDTEVNAVARRAKEVMDARKFAGILRALVRPAETFVDVGCGDGRFLRVMEKRGVERGRNYGLELDRGVVERLRGQGYQAFCERVEECRSIPEGTIDLATMFHVIEHVDDPGGVVRRMATWLAPGGVLALETPNIESWDARLFRKTYWGGYHFPRHWNLFSPATLARLMTDAGLEVVATRYQTGHSFWMWSMHHVVRYHAGSRPRLARLFNPMKGLPMLAAFTAFDKVRIALGCRTSSMLMLARRAGA